MAGVALIFNRDGRPLAGRLIDRAMHSLAHLGPDRIGSWRRGPFGLGQASLFGTLEDAAGAHPLIVKQPDVDVAIAYDGRLDNRPALEAALLASDPGPGWPRPLTDAALIALAYRRWGATCCDHLAGPAALIVVDSRRNRVLLYRDALGSRPLYYHLSDQRLLAASEPIALLGPPEVDSAVNPAWLASYFAFTTAPAGMTEFSAIKELLPGARLVCEWDRAEQSRPPLECGFKTIRYRCDTEYAEHFSELLGQSVANCLRSSKKIGVMLSGGLDSGPLAAIGQNQLATEGAALTAYSWSLSNFDKADESRAIGACADHLGIAARWVDGNEQWPFSRGDDWPLNPNTPFSNCFRRLILSLYREAQADGCGVLFNGHFGDRLYPSPSHYLVDLVGDRKARLLWREVVWRLRQGSVRAVTEDMALRALVNKLIGRKSRSAKLRPWVTAQAARLIEPAVRWPPEADAHRRPDHFRSMLGLEVARSISGEGHFACRHGIDRRDPYHTLALVDFMLSIPSYRCLRDGQTKLIARNAMRRVLPESIRLAPRTGLLTEFFNHGLAQSRRWTRELLFAADAEWPTYVDRAWLGAELENPSQSAAMLIWRCVTFELWRKAGITDRIGQAPVGPAATAANATFSAV